MLPAFRPGEAEFFSRAGKSSARTFLPQKKTTEAEKKEAEMLGQKWVQEIMDITADSFPNFETIPPGFEEGIDFIGKKEVFPRVRTLEQKK